MTFFIFSPLLAMKKNNSFYSLFKGEQKKEGLWITLYGKKKPFPWNVDQKIKQSDTFNDVLFLAKLQYKLALFILEHTENDVPIIEVDDNGKAYESDDQENSLSSSSSDSEYDESEDDQGYESKEQICTHPLGDFSFRTCSMIENNPNFTAAAKEDIQVFMSLIHHLNYANAIKKSGKINFTEQIIKNIGKSIVGVRPFLCDTSTYKLDQKKDTLFVENYYKSKNPLTATQKELQINFSFLMKSLFLLKAIKIKGRKFYKKTFKEIKLTQYYCNQDRLTYKNPTLSESFYYPKNMDKVIVKIHNKKEYLFGSNPNKYSWKKYFKKAKLIKNVFFVAPKKHKNNFFDILKNILK